MCGKHKYWWFWGNVCEVIFLPWAPSMNLDHWVSNQNLASYQILFFWKDFLLHFLYREGFDWWTGKENEECLLLHECRPDVGQLLSLQVACEHCCMYVIHLLFCQEFICQSRPPTHLNKEISFLENWLVGSWQRWRLSFWLDAFVVWSDSWSIHF